ncbi:MAG: hypothetical protein AAFX41_04220 [Bacteroidota bacterium]
MGIPTQSHAAAAAVEAQTDVATRLLALAGDARDHGSPSAFQAVVAAERCALRDVLHHTATARTAALSLAQHERLDAMASELHTLNSALDAVLEASGRCLVDADTQPSAPPYQSDRVERPRLWLWRRPSPPPAQPSPAPSPLSWGSAVTHLLTALDEQVDRLQTLASGQPDQAPSRLLADDVCSVLARHRDMLRAETRRCAA